MFFYLMLNKHNYKKSQLNQSLKNKNQLKVRKQTLNGGINMNSSTRQIRVRLGGKSLRSLRL